MFPIVFFEPIDTLQFGGDNCTLGCPKGMVGAAVNYTCLINGTWFGNLTCSGLPFSLLMCC